MMEVNYTKDFMEALIKRGQGRNFVFLVQFYLLTKRCQHR